MFANLNYLTKASLNRNYDTEKKTKITDSSTPALKQGNKFKKYHKKLSKNDKTIKKCSKK
jgi:nucleoid DNA-binding protein